MKIVPPPSSKFIPHLIKILLASLIFVLAGLLGIQPALAVGAAYFQEETTIELTLAGTTTNFQVLAGSDGDSVEVTSDRITLTISGGQKFTLRSSDRKKLTNDGSYSYSCPSAYSELVIDLASGAAQKTVIISPESANCSTLVGGGGGVTGGGGGGGGGASAQTTTPTPAASTPSSGGSVDLAKYNLKDGDVVSASGTDDPDVYIVNQFGFKRLFLNPIIFSFYGHLGGFGKVKTVASITRDVFGTSSYFRNCESNDPKVYAVEVTGEDKGTLRWINTSGDQAVKDDPDFFKKVFCINNKEFSWYPKGTAYTSVKQVPAYVRSATIVAGVSTEASQSLTIGGGIKWLNVRNKTSIKGNIVAKAYPGEEYTYTKKSNGWYLIQKDGTDLGWVIGTYVKVK